MRKAVLGILLLMAATTADAQMSRFIIGAGGGGTNGGQKHDRLSAFGIDPMAMFSMNYTYTYNIFLGTGLGVKSGLNIGYVRPTIKSRTDLTDIFVNTDYEGNELQYTTTANDVEYKQKAVTFDIPVMVAIQTNCFYCNVGAKFIFPVWNRYTQTMTDATITAYSPATGKTFVDDPATGVVSEAQMNLSGKESVSPMYVSFAIEFGFAFEIKDHHHIGVELFVDALMKGVGGQKHGTLPVIEVGQITQPDVQPAVTVNTLANCYDFNFQYPKFGLKLFYCFDMKHDKKSVKSEETQAAF